MLAMVMFPRYFVWKFVRPFHYPNFLGFFCSIPFLPRAKKMHLVGYNTKNMTYRLWDPERPHEITGCRFARRSPVTWVARRQGMIRFPIQERLCQGSRLKNTATRICREVNGASGTTDTPPQKQQAARIYHPTVSRRSNGLSLLT